MLCYIFLKRKRYVRKKSLNNLSSPKDPLKVVHLSSSVDRKNVFHTFYEDTINVDDMNKAWPFSTVGISHKINLFRLTSDLHRFPKTDNSVTGTVSHFSSRKINTMFYSETTSVKHRYVCIIHKNKNCDRTRNERENGP